MIAVVFFTIVVVVVVVLVAIVVEIMALAMLTSPMEKKCEGEERR